MSFGQTHEKNTMVAYKNSVASQIGINILKKGENILPTF